MIAVIIVSWNVCAQLHQCLTSLKAELERSDTEATVWVVDNASHDGSASMVRARHPWVQLEEPLKNLGYVRGNNLILKHLLQRQTIPELIWLLNPDTEVHPGALDALKHGFKTHPRAGLVGPKLLNADGTLQHSAFHFPGLLQPLCELGWLPLRFYDTSFNGRYPRKRYEASDPFRVDHPLGAAMMVRGTTLADIGPLDEQFVMYCEEIDWAWRMHKAGWESWIVPEATVTHHSGASAQQAKPRTTTHLWESRARLYRKHHHALIYTLVSLVVRRTFSQIQASSPEWEQAYHRIIQAWTFSLSPRFGEGVRGSG